MFTLVSIEGWLLPTLFPNPPASLMLVLVLALELTCPIHVLA
uniref:Uncharacterized protein n=1 Tax=Arundo donax TaxID=35708 RepID=A0A0A9GII0_ARUDO